MWWYRREIFEDKNQDLLPTETAEPIVESAYFEMDRVYRLPMQTESSTWLGEDSVLSFVYVLCQTSWSPRLFQRNFEGPASKLKVNEIKSWLEIQCLMMLRTMQWWIVGFHNCRVFRSSWANSLPFKCDATTASRLRRHILLFWLMRKTLVLWCFVFFMAFQVIPVTWYHLTGWRTCNTSGFEVCSILYSYCSNCFFQCTAELCKTVEVQRANCVYRLNIFKSSPPFVRKTVVTCDFY